MEEIAKIIYEYSLNNKIADEKFVKDIVNILIDAYGLDYYIKNVVVNGKNSDSSYNVIDRKLSINLTSAKYKLPLLPIKNRALFINLNVALTIFHEVDHALFIKLKELGKDTIDIQLYNITCIADLIERNTEILKSEYAADSLKEFMKTCLTMLKNYTYYNVHHDRAPFERRAIVNAHLHLSRILDLLYETSLSNKDLDTIRTMNLRKFIRNCRDGYRCMGEVTNSPSYDYVKELTSLEELSKIEIYNYSPFVAYGNVKMYKLRDRVLYGLPMSKDELKEINKQSNPFHVYEKKIKR